jgi:23S rRNA (adenine-N6)-dimethyltransferase
MKRGVFFMSRFSRAPLRPLWISQNYLTNHRLIEKLLSIAQIGRDDYVVEIGPGKGHITASLLERAGQVSAVELDESLVLRLMHRFAGHENLRLYHQDFLCWPLPVGRSYKVFANIPFNLTTAIVRRLTQAPNPPDQAWLVMEKGAAKRFMGQPREDALSLSIKPFFDIEIRYYFRRENFHPSPAVDAVLLLLSRKATPDLLPGQRRSYERFVRRALETNWQDMRPLLTKKQLQYALRHCGLSPLTGDILYIQWLCLFRCCYPCLAGRR